MNDALKRAEDYFSRANELYSEHKYEGAVEAVERAIELAPGEPKYWYNRGVYQGMAGLHREAVESFERVVSLEPAYSSAWFNMAVAYASLGMVERAIKAITSFIEKEPANGDGWFNRACYFALKRKEESALSDLKRAIEIDSKYGRIAADVDVLLELFALSNEFREMVGEVEE